MTIYRAKSLPYIGQSKHPNDRAIFEFFKRNSIPEISYKEYRILYYGLTAERMHVATGGKNIQDRDGFLKIVLACAREDEGAEQGGKFSFHGIDSVLVESYNDTSHDEVNCGRFSDFIRARLASGINLSAILNKMLGGNASQSLWDNVCKASFVVDTLADLKKDIASGFVKKMRLKDFAALGAELAKCSVAVIKEFGLVAAIKNLLPSTLIMVSGGIHCDKTNNKLFAIGPAPSVEKQVVPAQALQPRA